jgi:hypothetical protein
MVVVVVAMRHGWVYIYEIPPAEARFEELMTLAQNGITLARPGSAEIARLSAHGDRIVCSKQDIFREIEKSNYVSVQLYLDASTGLLCLIEKLGPDLVRESYSLDGKTERESLHVIRSVIQLFSYRAERGIAFAVVVDRHADLHRDFHWDDFVLGTSKPPEWPMFLGFSKNFRRLKDLPQSYQTVDKGTYLLLTSTTSGIAVLEDVSSP